MSRPACWCRRAWRRSASQTTINKVPGANWRTELTKKTMPLFTNVFSGWLDYPEYFFYWCYHSGKSIFNTMDYQSPAMDAFIDGARAAAATGDMDSYDKDVKGFVDLALHRHAAHSALSALCQRRDAEEHHRLPVLVSPPARLPHFAKG